MSRLAVRLRAFTRFGVLLAMIALAVALVLSARSNRQDAERLSVLLDRSQSERFFRPIPRIHERNGGPASRNDLAQVLAQFEPEGLRYLAEFDREGNLIVESGTHQGVRPMPGGSSGEPVVMGERVRVTFHAPQRRPPSGGPGGAPPGPPPSRPGTTSRASLPDLVIEFEPIISSQLRERASKSFVFSCTAAVALLTLTLGLGLALVREDRDRRRRERERQLTALGEMSAVLAHEIRNPLASLKGTAQLLAEQVAPGSPLHRKVSRIVDEAKRLEELSTTLLDLVRSSSVSPTKQDPARLLRDAAQAVAPEYIILDTSAAPATWPLDAPRMDQVLRNLLENAVQACAAPARQVEASIGVERGQLRIRIRDHGPGLPAGAEQKIFEPFHTTRTHGTGLGLAVARRIVELHGGRITGENHPQGGALFTLFVPG